MRKPKKRIINDMIYQAYESKRFKGVIAYVRKDRTTDGIVDACFSPEEGRKLAKWWNQWADWAEYKMKKIEDAKKERS